MERTIADVLGTWSVARWEQIPAGSEWLLDGLSPPWNATVQARVDRRSGTIFLLTASVTVPTTPAPVTAIRTVTLELRRMSAEPAAALTAGGSVRFGAAGDVRTDPECAHPDSAVAPLVLVPPGTHVDLWGPGADSRVAYDSVAADPATYAQPAGLDLAQLVAMAAADFPAGASVAPQPSAESGSCRIAQDHWGEPRRETLDMVEECAERYPIISAAGDLRIDGGRGQGILYVPGRLQIVGPFEFSGVIIASGGVETSGGEVFLSGAVFTGPGTGVLASSETVFERSSCALSAAAAAAAWITPIPMRAWGR
ncbi:MAG TPA: hypothetical protein VFT96_13205 [Gemmatimonadaceae bacterium]|nr:hypothetical protein [Gemmatimonadaceae bacterium]